MPRRHIPIRRLEHIQALLKLLNDALWEEDLKPAGGQLDCQWQAPHKLTDPQDEREGFRGQDRASLRPSRSLHEQLHRRVVPCSLQGGPSGLGNRETFNAEHPLRLQVQPLSRGDEEIEVRAVPHEINEQRSAFQEVLEVIQHQQRTLLREETNHLDPSVNLTCQHQAQRTSQGIRNRPCGGIGPPAERKTHRR